MRAPRKVRGPEPDAPQWRERVAQLMERARAGAPNLSKPDVKLSIAAHLSVVGGYPDVVVDIAEGAGISPSAIREAIRVLSTNPEELEREQRETAMVLAGMMSAEVTLEAHAGAYFYDLSRAELLESIWRGGWISAVLARDPSAGAPAAGTEEATAWRDGRAAFRSELKAFMTRRTAA